MVSPLFRPVGLLAGSCSVIQAFAWSVLSLIGILTYVQVIDPPDLFNIRHGDVFPYMLACVYFRENVPQCACSSAIGVMSPDDIVIIIGIYFAFSVVWLAVSVTMLTNVYKREMKYTRNVLYAWVGVTGVVCLLDFSVALSFGMDYSKMLEYDVCTVYLAVSATMMSLAARGYVLWVLNVAAVVYLARAATRLDDDQDAQSQPRSSRESSIISTMYQQPADAIHQDTRSILYRKPEYAAPAPGNTNGWAIQSPQVGADMRTCPWNFQQPPQPPPPAMRQPPPSYPPPAAIPVRAPVPPLPSYIPDPDYDDYEDGSRMPAQQRQKHEPRPFNEVPRRSALKKQRSAGHMGRTVF